MNDQTGSCHENGIAPLFRDAIIAELNERGAKIVISQHPRRSRPLAIDQEMYKWRHLIENLFGELKEFKRIALRAEEPIRASQP